MAYFQKIYNWNRELKESLLIFLFGGLVQVTVEACMLEPEAPLQITFLIHGTFWVMLWKGSEYLAYRQEKIGLSWKEQPLKRLFITALVIFLYVIVVFLILYIVFFVGLLDYKIQNIFDYRYEFLSTLFTTIAINTFMHGRAFLMEWRQAAIDNEKLKTESVQAKFESLRNQVNPHFLFNSLNALSTLIYSDQDKADEFVQKLSLVYRYVIDHTNDEVVSLKTELEFLESYIYLVTIRFGKNLKVSYQHLDQVPEGLVPPVSLQLLLENCLKHNEVSNEYPLHIQIVYEDGYISVINNLNPLKNPKKDSTKLGINNLKDRYQYLTDLPVIVTHDQEYFTVKLPILKLS